jgi:hypothetical protein
LGLEGHAEGHRRVVRAAAAKRRDAPVRRSADEPGHDGEDAAFKESADRPHLVNADGCVPGHAIGAEDTPGRHHFRAPAEPFDRGGQQCGALHLAGGQQQVARPGGDRHAESAELAAELVGHALPRRDHHHDRLPAPLGQFPGHEGQTLRVGETRPTKLLDDAAHG